MIHFKLGEILLEQGLITQEQLAEAVIEQKKSKGRIGETLINLDFLTEDLATTDVQLRWKYLTEDQRREFNNALFEIVTDLPEMQRVTAIVFITRYKEIRETNLFSAVAERVREFSGKDITAAAAKGNWYRARKRIAEEFRRRGFDVFSPE